MILDKPYVGLGHCTVWKSIYWFLDSCWLGRCTARLVFCFFSFICIQIIFSPRYVTRENINAMTFDFFFVFSIIEIIRLYFHWIFILFWSYLRPLIIIRDFLGNIINWNPSKCCPFFLIGRSDKLQSGVFNSNFSIRITFDILWSPYPENFKVFHAITTQMWQIIWEKPWFSNENFVQFGIFILKNIHCINLRIEIEIKM